MLSAFYCSVLDSNKLRRKVCRVGIRLNENPNAAIAPVSIHSGAIEHLRYIREAIDASRTFTAVPGKGCIAMGLIALLAAALESTTVLSAYWLAVWSTAAATAAPVGLSFMRSKARTEGLSLRLVVARRFFLTLAPAIVAGAILTVALTGVVGRETIAGVWLLLYGAAVFACGVSSIPVVMVAGAAFMVSGTIALLLPPAAAPVLLAVGFGGIHIALGTIVLRRHGG
jgi:hypothetical protein